MFPCSPCSSRFSGGDGLFSDRSSFLDRSRRGPLEGWFCFHVAHFVAFSRSRVALTVLVPEVRLAAHPGRTALADLELDQRDWEEYRAHAAAEQGRARQLSSACCCFATMSWRGFDLRIVSEQRGRCSAVPPKSLTSAADGADASKLVLRERPHAFYGAHLQQK